MSRRFRRRARPFVLTGLHLWQARAGSLSRNPYGDSTLGERTVPGNVDSPTRR